MVKMSNYQDIVDNRPSPLNFDEYLPWACRQLSIEAVVIVKRVQQADYNDGLSSMRRDRKAKTQQNDNSDVISMKTRVSEAELYRIDSSKDDHVIVNTIYDNYENLTQLKFHKNVKIPRTVLKVIALLAQFHPYLNSIHIDKGLDKYGMHELGKILALSKVTEIILNNLVLQEGNCYLLLDNNSSLKYLSLARCQLNDVVVGTIASRLVYPSSASKTLSILNLSSNRITDLGAKYVSEALRSNRQLSYLNLAGNMITDEGADSIFSVLGEFPLSLDEIREAKVKRMTYYKKANEIMMEITKNTQFDETDKKSLSKKPAKVIATKKSKLTVKASKSSTVKIDSMSLDRAKVVAKTQLGPYDDPFSSENVVIKEGTVYCLGNNALCSINLAYNNLSYFSVRKLYNVLSVQNKMNRSPKGLIKVCIEGNNLPESCMEYSAIDYMLNGLGVFNRLSVSRKKTSVKSSK